MTKALFGLVNNLEQAQRIVDRLISSGFSNDDISILSPDKSQQKPTGTGRIEDVPGTTKGRKKDTLGTEKHTKAPEGGVTGATAGGILGGSLGLLAGIGALAIPGLGPFIAAGPLLGALSGSGIGGGVGLVIGALVGSGIPEYEAKKYENGLKAGNILLCVHTEDSNDLDRAKDIFKREGAKDISTSSEKTKAR